MDNRYKLVWSDEFTNDGNPDVTKWQYCVGGTGFGNNEKQYYTGVESENAYISNGKLIIEAKKEEVENCQYTSAKLTTFNKQAWTYGKFEIRAKMPRGGGLWPAIWMLPDALNEGVERWPNCGEIDIMENVGRHADRVHFSLHSEFNNHKLGTQFTKVIDLEDIADEFYTYSLIWEEDYIEFCIDDYSYYKVERECYRQEWPFNKPFYLILNVAVGGDWGGKIDESVFPQKMEVEFVRVYQK